MSQFNLARRFLPPGPAFLLVKVLPFFLLQSTLVCSLLKGYSKFWDVQIPNWVYTTAVVVIHPLCLVVKRALSSRARQRDRILKGAEELPAVDLPSGEILRQCLHTFLVGYPGEVFWKWSQIYGSAFSFNTYGEKRIFTIEPEDVKAILSTKFNDFHKGPTSYESMSDLLGTGIFNADGDTWKFHRNMTRPFFTKDRVSDFENFERHAWKAILLIKDRLKEGYPVDFQDVVSRFTLDSASEFLFGKDVKSLEAGTPYPQSSGVPNGVIYDNHPSNVFVNAFVQGQIGTAKRARYGELWPLREFWKDEISPHRQVIEEYVKPLMSNALSKKTAGYLDHKEEESGNLLTDLVVATDDTRAIQDELINILVAGRDTTASLLTFAIYALTEHPDIMHQLREEILNTVGQRTPTYDDLRSMKYLRAVLNETLRMYPPVPFDARSSIGSTTFPRQDGKLYYIPPDTKVRYGIFWMHRREDLWGPTVMQFDPNRFIDERVKYIVKNPFIFVPFNAGPRICLGQQFAYNEASYFLVRLLQSFSSVSVADELQQRPPPEWAAEKVIPGSTKSMDTVVLAMHLTMYVKGGLWVTMQEDLAATEGN